MFTIKEKPAILYSNTEISAIVTTDTRMIKTFHAIWSKFECNGMSPKVVCEVMVSDGILKSGTIIRQFYNEEKSKGISSRPYKN